MIRFTGLALLCSALIFSCAVEGGKETKFNPGSPNPPQGGDGGGGRPILKPSPQEETEAINALQGHWESKNCFLNRTRREGKKYSFIITGSIYYFSVNTYEMNRDQCGRIKTRDTVTGPLNFVSYDRNSKTFGIRIGRSDYQLKIGRNVLDIRGVAAFNLFQRPEAIPYQRPILAECPNFNGRWSNSIEYIDVVQRECMTVTHAYDLEFKEFFVDNNWWKNILERSWIRSYFTESEMWIERKNQSRGEIDVREKHYLTKNPCGQSSSDLHYVIEIFEGSSSKPNECRSYSKN